MDLSLYADIKPPFELKLEFEKRRRTPSQSHTPLHVCLVCMCVRVCGTKREGKFQTGYPHTGRPNIASTPSSAHLSLSCTKHAPSAISTNLMFYTMTPSAYQLTTTCNSRCMCPLLRTTATQGRMTLVKLQPSVKLTGELPSRSEGLAVGFAVRAVFYFHIN